MKTLFFTILFGALITLTSAGFAGAYYPANDSGQHKLALLDETEFLPITPILPIIPLPPTYHNYLPAVAKNVSDTTVCSKQNAAAVVIVVDPSLINQIRSGLNQYEADLCNEGYTVIEKTSTFSTPPEVRSYLGEVYARTQHKLEGVILIGNIPHAYQWYRITYANPNIPPLEQEVISYQYYSDLDGVFQASPGYVSPGGHPYSYDIHSGNVNWETWVGVLPYYKGNLSETVNAINNYFVKNHAYRTGAYSLPKKFLEVNELNSAVTVVDHNLIMNLLRTGWPAWTPFSSASDALIYFDSAEVGMTVDQGYDKLSSGAAAFTVLDAHGSPYGSGKLTLPWFGSHQMKTAFLWSNGCSVGNIDVAENFLSYSLYNPNSMVVVAKGTTNDSGGMGTNQNGFFGHNIATALSQGKTFGQAILYHVNVPLVETDPSWRESYYSLSIILGDPSLKYP